MNKELWKDLPEYEGYYQVSSLGRVKSLNRYIINSKGIIQLRKGKLLKPYIKRDGRLNITLSKDGIVKIRPLARLVLKAFNILPEDESLQAMYIDGNINNNSITNLRWATSQEVTTNAVENNTLQPVTARKVKIFKDNYQLEFNSAADADRYLGCSLGNIARVAKGTQPHIYGWKATYTDTELVDKSYDNEVWRAIPGYEGTYEASDKGRIRSVDRVIINSAGKRHPYKGQIIKPQINQGYETVRLHNQDNGERIAVHRLVALTFVPNEDNKPDINHINHIRDDNRIENLEWVTKAENNKAYRDFINKGEK